MTEPKPSEQEIRGVVQKLIWDILDRKKSAVSLGGIVEGVSLTRDLGIDSLDILQLTASVEKRFKIRFPESDIKQLDDLGAIMAAIKQLLPSGS